MVKVKAGGAGSGVATLEFDMSWENSWRDSYNWDAVWIFLKYNTGTGWKQVMLKTEGHDVGAAYVYTPGKSGDAANGVFVYRKEQGSGTSEISCRLSWALPTELAGYTQKDFDEKGVYVIAQGIEMVFIPSGNYYLGDNTSSNSFRPGTQKIFSPEYDIINLTSGYHYSMIPKEQIEVNCGAPSAAANRVNDAGWPSPNACHATKNDHGNAASYNNSWIVNFKTLKTIRSFGVSGSTYGGGSYLPDGNWHLLGSLDSLSWDTLWTGGPEHYKNVSTSYPVQHVIRVTQPGAYQYYRVFVPKVTVNDGVFFANVAMSEVDLLSETYNAVKGEDKIVLSDNLGGLYAGSDAAWTGELPAAYPKGYRGFYVMKYEISQEQYVAFLNTLTLAQQTEILPGLGALKAGEYVFGDKTRPTNRNGIMIIGADGANPALFANNLNPADPYNGDDDGKYVACNFMNVNDMLAYCSWSGLRPMSEMEYEKASRPPYPVPVVAGEYAWNSAANLTQATTLTNPGEKNERSDGNSNYNNGLGAQSGPVRCGAFAAVKGGQEAAGATFWGVMEMSGNTGELCCNVSYRAFDRSVHGRGAYNPTLWSAVPDNYGVRGGDFGSSPDLLRISDRSNNRVANISTRDKGTGFRAAYTMPDSLAVLVAGNIHTAKTTLCTGEPLTIEGDAASVSDGGALLFTYAWYEKKGVGDFAEIPGENGMNLELPDGLENNTTTRQTYVFKRKAMCGLGETETVPLTLTVINPEVKLSVDTALINVCHDGTLVAAKAVTTDITPRFRWLYNGVQLDTLSNYLPKYSHFDILTPGYQEIVCVSNVGGCISNKTLTVDATRPLPVLPTDVTHENCGNVTVVDNRGGGDIEYYCTVLIPGKIVENGVTLPDQCWFGNNMNVGISIQGSVYNTHTTAGIQKICYADKKINCDRYGALYSWDETVYGNQTAGIKYVPGSTTLIQGICPDGWHVPSDEEFVILERNQGMSQSQAALTSGWRGTNEGTKLKILGAFEGINWCTGADCNKSGFKGLPGGYRHPSNGTFSGLGGNINLWSSTVNNGTYAWYRYWASGSGQILRPYNDRTHGFGVRCLKN